MLCRIDHVACKVDTLSVASFQERCRAIIKTKPSLAELTKLDAEAEELPAIIPEMDALNRCVLLPCA